MFLTFYITGMASLRNVIELLKRVDRYLQDTNDRVVAVQTILGFYREAIQTIDKTVDEWKEIKQLWQNALNMVEKQIQIVLDQLQQETGFTEYVEIICRGLFATILTIIFELIIKAPLKTADITVSKTILDTFFTLLNEICDFLNGVQDIIKTIKCFIYGVCKILEVIISILAEVSKKLTHCSIPIAKFTSMVAVLGVLIDVFNISPQARLQYNQISPPDDLSPVSRTAGLVVGAVVGRSVCPIPVLGAVVGGFVGRWTFHFGHRVYQNIFY